MVVCCSLMFGNPYPTLFARYTCIVQLTGSHEVSRALFGVAIGQGVAEGVGSKVACFHIGNLYEPYVIAHHYSIRIA